MLRSPLVLTSSFLPVFTCPIWYFQPPLSIGSKERGWSGWQPPEHDSSATSSRLNKLKMVFKLKQLKNLPSKKNILAFQFLTICCLILQFDYENIVTSLPYSRKTLIYLFAQLKCIMRLQIVRNWNVNMFFLDGRFFNCFNLRTIFNSFSLLDVALGHALAAVTHSTLVNLFGVHWSRRFNHRAGTHQVAFTSR